MVRLVWFNLLSSLACLLAWLPNSLLYGWLPRYLSIFTQLFAPMVQLNSGLVRPYESVLSVLTTGQPNTILGSGRRIEARQHPCQCLCGVNINVSDYLTYLRSILGLA